MSEEATPYWAAPKQPVVSEEQKTALKGALLTTSVPGGYHVWYGGAQVTAFDSDWRSLGTKNLVDADIRMRYLVEILFPGEAQC